MPTTHVTTFGYEYSGPPNYADRVYDVRDLDDYPKDPEHKLEDRADIIMKELHPGDNIAIGCDYGHDRSTFIAKTIQDNYPDVTVEHLDYDKHAKKVESAATERVKQGRDGGELSNPQGRGVSRETKGSDHAQQSGKEQEA